MKKILFIMLVSLLTAVGVPVKADDNVVGAYINGLHPISANPDVPMAVMIAGEQVLLDRIDMYERLDREMTQIIYGHSNLFLSIKRANRYFPIIVPILRKNGIPEDFAYLAIVESYLSPTARSYAGAVGMWQFLKGTAKQYGLIVNDEVDERYDPAKSTEAACRYLKVAASYNAGMGRISKELDRQLADNSFDLYLNEETSRYVFRFIAMKLILEQPKKYGFFITRQQLYQPVKYTEVNVSGSVASWSDWARKHGISYSQLREMNPWIRSPKLVNREKRVYTVKIPKEESLYRSKTEYTVYNENWIVD